MKREVVIRAMERRPFRRFAVRLTDGRLVQIRGVHRAAVHPNANSMVVFEENGGCRIIDLALITELQSA